MKHEKQRCLLLKSPLRFFPILTMPHLFHFCSDPLVVSELVGLVFTAWMIWVPSVAPLSLDGDGEESDPRLATPTATVTSTATGADAGIGTRSEFPSTSSSSSSQMPYASPSHSRSHSHSSALSFEAVDESSRCGDVGGSEAVSVGGAVRVARVVAPPATASSFNGYVIKELLDILVLTFIFCRAATFLLISHSYPANFPRICFVALTTDDRRFRALPRTLSMFHRP